MSKRNQQTRLWKNIAAALDEMDDQSLRGLVHDLFNLSPEIRAYLAAWIGYENATVELLDGYKASITSQFYGRTKPRFSGGCDFSLCKRLIKEYRRVTTAREMIGGFDVRGTIDLSLHFLEVGTQYVNNIGWSEEKLYIHLGAVADDLSKLIVSKVGRRWARVFLPRVHAVVDAASDIGYGYCDDLADLADSFEEAAALFQEQRYIKQTAPVAVRRFAIYTRQSTEPRDGFSTCEAQFQTCLQFANAEAAGGNKWIGERFDDGGISGKTLDRPAINRLRERVKAGLIDRVYAASLDRYSRNVTDTIQLLEEFERAGVDVCLAHHVELCAQPESRLLRHI